MISRFYELKAAALNIAQEYLLILKHIYLPAMKNLFYSFLLTTGFAFTAKAQQKPLAPTEYKDHIGKEATLCDTVYGVKIFSDTLTLLNMGGNYPNQKFTIAIKGNKLQLDWVNLKRKHVCVTGLLELYKNSLEIVASEPNQITVSK